MVQIIQSQPTQRQSALMDAFGQFANNFGNSYLDGQKTLRQQALQEQALAREELNAKMAFDQMSAEKGIGVSYEDAKAFAQGQYQPKEIEAAKEAVPAQYGKELQGPTMPGQGRLREILFPAQEGKPAVVGPSNPYQPYFERKRKEAEQAAMDKKLDREFKQSQITNTNEKQKFDRFDKNRNFELKQQELGIKRESEGSKSIDDIRKEISTLPATKDMVNIDAALGKVNSAEDSAAGDMSLIYGFMKIQDPGSTVREGEFATAQNAGSIPERIRASYNKALSGERLTPVQREDFKKSASTLGRSQYKTFKSFIEPHMKAISERGLDQSQIVPNFSQADIYNNENGTIPKHPPADGFDQTKASRLAELRAKAGKSQ